MFNFKCAVSLLINLVVATSLVAISHASRSDDLLTIKHYQEHSRYRFGLSVLDLVLKKSGTSYQLQTPISDINEGRGEKLVIRGELDLEFMSTTVEREKNMIAVKIPIYRGLLGARLLLINKSDRDKFNLVHDLDGLRHFVGGHGAHWGDLPVYGANGLRVSTSATYANLFKMLKAHRFDYFHRGISEIWGELSQHEADFTIVDNVFLFYPHPIYFFVTRTKPELARQIEKGFQLAILDGSYEQLFKSEYGSSIQRAELGSRNLIALRNPVNPPCTPPIDASWWIPEKYKAQILQISPSYVCSGLGEEDDAPSYR